MRTRSLLIIGLNVILLLSLAFVVRAQDGPQREIYTVLSYGDGVFEPDIWLASASEQGARTTAEWRADQLGALAYLDYVHFDGGLTDQVFKSTFGEEWFNVTLSSYEGWVRLVQCEIEDIQLHDFSLRINDIKYTMRYWIQAAPPDRVLTLFVIFPTADRESLDTYASRLFPNAPSCQTTG